MDSEETGFSILDAFWEGKNETILPLNQQVFAFQVAHGLHICAKWE